MPLPLGHTAIGLAINSVIKKKKPTVVWWKLLLVVIVLANLPDIDIIFGLIFTGNGYAFHRGPTHSILFAMVCGLFAGALGKHSRVVPNLGGPYYSSIIFSHIVADIIQSWWKYGTLKSTSLFFPFNLFLSDGQDDVWGIISLVTENSFGEYKIVLFSLLFMLLVYVTKYLYQKRRV